MKADDCAHDHYESILKIMMKLAFYGDVEPPSIVVCDRELAIVNAIKHILPNAQINLCRWHVDKKVESKICDLEDGIEKEDDDIRKKMMDCWYNIRSSKSIQDYNTNLSILKTTYPGLHSYLQREYLNDHKGSIVDYYINQHRHFGHIHSSPVEKQNDLIKRYRSLPRS